jgi:hypothetical protein
MLAVALLGLWMAARLTGETPGGARVAAASAEVVPVGPGPALEIRYPLDDSLVSTKRFTFYGVTSPGATILVDGRRTEPNKKGHWSLRMILKKGENVFTFIAQKDKGRDKGITTEKISVWYYPD